MDYFEVNADPFRHWHRLFGLLLTEHPAGSPFKVELEMDLAKKQQRLDVIILRREPGELTRPLPDGLNDLVDHNLITFKSHREPLNDWALKEQTGHYVNYRKQVSPRKSLIPESAFRLIAVCSRLPRELFRAARPKRIGRGVSTCQRGSDAIRIVVAAKLPKTERNALLHLFSAAEDQVQYGVEHYHLETSDWPTIINQLFVTYQREGLTMPYTMNDFRKDIALEVLDQLTPEQRMAGLPPEQRMAGLPPEQRLSGLSAEQIERYLKNRRPGSPIRRVKKARTKGIP